MVGTWKMTNRTKYGVAYAKIAINESNMPDAGKCYTGKIIDRLAAYEESDMLPEQVQELIQANKKLQMQIEKMKDALKAIKRLDKTEYYYNGAKARNKYGEYPPKGEKWKTPTEIASEALNDANTENIELIQRICWWCGSKMEYKDDIESNLVEDLTLQGWVCPKCGKIVFPQKEVRKEEGEMKRRKARGEEG